jgi:hypothetical protein
MMVQEWKKDRAGGRRKVYDRHTHSAIIYLTNAMKGTAMLCEKLIDRGSNLDSTRYTSAAVRNETDTLASV